jgi:anoctamin-1
VAAFPLAPLFALLNNVLEMRLDATKMLIYNRRPVGQKAKNIGIWYGILDTISRIAVISNALIIAFTSNFIPKIMFLFLSDDRDSHPFFEHSLVSFNISDFHNQTKPVPRPESQELWNQAQESGICW